MPAVGSAYVMPESPRVAWNENAGWKFALDPAGTPQARAFDDRAWAAVGLPHTWNAVDGASPGYAAGSGWYRKTVTVDAAAAAGKRLYLDFEGGSLVTSLYIDGTPVDYKPSTAGVDAHEGGFGEFLFDVTAQLTPGVSHVIAVRVNNQKNAAVVPAGGGDYSKQGGLYRDVSLLALPATHVARTESVPHAGLAGSDNATPVATPGVYFGHSPVVTGAASAAVTVRTVLDNAAAVARPVTVTSYLVDAAGLVRARQASSQTLAAGAAGVSLVQSTTLDHPHLWDGRIDPYLYDLYVEVRDPASDALLDMTRRRVGVRSFTVNANAANDPGVAPFLLNGHRYTLVGADFHQDSGRADAGGHPVGWAQSDAQLTADVDLMLDMGVTVLRTSHYQIDPAFYDYCDRVGMLVYTESPINGTVTAGDAFLANAQDQYQELVRQTYDNPSVFAWGFGNETTSSPAAIAVFKQLNTIAHGLDSTRKTGFATYGGSPSTATNLDGIADIKGTHRYDYWYPGNTAGARQVQNTLNAYPTQPLAVTEMGGGASAYQYADGPITLPAANHFGGVKTHFHPANQQSLIEATQITDYASLHNLWARIIWQAFDTGSTGKNEGDQNGVNDKGLITRGRVPKDAYYYFQAIWNDPTRNYANKKVVYVSDHFWTVRNCAATTVTAYSNVGAPTLSLNGKSLGVMRPLVVAGATGAATVRDAYAMDLTLPTGDSNVTAARAYGDGVTYSDSVTWTYRDPDAFAAEKVVADAVAVNRTFDYSPVYRTTRNPFQYELPNGLYDVRIVAPAGGVNNLSLQGQTAAIDSNGPDAADTFYARARVTDGRLTLAGAPGAYHAAVTTLDVRLADETPPVAAAP